MNKIEFMSQLKIHLRKLPFDEVREAVDYYEQYFDDAGEENEQAVISELGSPSAVASQIIASFAVNTEKSAKKGLATAWMAILAVFSSHAALPIAIATVVIAIALVIVMLSVIFSISVAGISSVLGGIVSLVTGVSVILQSFPTAMFFLGLGLIASGIGLAIIAGTAQLAKICFPVLAKKIGEFILRRNRK